MTEDGLTAIFSGSSTKHIYPETSIVSRRIIDDTIDTFNDITKSGKSIDIAEIDEDNESTSIEFTEVTDLPKYKSIWHKIYYEYIILDKSTLDVSIKESFLYNNDLKPVEEKRRVWSWYNYLYFWLADCFNINTWQVAGTGMQLGLNWWQCWLTVWIGYTFAGIFVVLSSRVGSAYHLSFPISCRAAFGIFFSLWPIINRIVMAIVWYAVQAWLGAQPVSLMLRSIFGKDLPDRIPNHFGSPNSTTYEFMCFFIFWVVSIPFVLVPPHKIRHLFTVKAVLIPFAAFGFLIWALKRSHGKIALSTLNDFAPGGSEFSWIFVRSMMSCIANFAALIINAPDFSRFAKSPNASLWPQLIAIPLFFAITCLIGILVTAAGYEMFGINYWSPLDVLGKFLETSYTRGARAGVFLISFVFALAQLGTNISANSLSCGTDMTALFPRYINIKRGGVFCIMMALCICPWNLMSSSSKFTSSLSAYSIFLSSIYGCIFCDYYIVRRGYLKLTHMFLAQEGSYYMYGNRYGFNWRALVAYLCGIAPNLPGFIHDVGNNINISDGAIRLYYLGYPVGFFIAAVIYLTLCWFFPVPGVPVHNFLKDRGWHQRWAYVENFEEQWREELQRSDLVSDTISVDELNWKDEKIIY
ncbi:allantoin permease [Monosporozyma unispora]